ncbi:hypothetical protein DERF_001876 [Dermatophagoides farinae]|uniref:Uncharacterized protein n=1 Tax=Dermatophagoides farinae TaxID=6954 RepID=A0A922I9H6_DERFA|nr:hypothetical protein DERF_001876 [Dermatophagoides farinae]
MQYLSKIKIFDYFESKKIVRIESNGNLNHSAFTLNDCVTYGKESHESIDTNQL